MGELRVDLVDVAQLIERLRKVVTSTAANCEQGQTLVLESGRTLGTARDIAAPPGRHCPQG